jgi:hypothetical protein
MTEDPGSAPTSTIPDEPTQPGRAAERAIHIAAFSLVGLVMLLGAIGIFGVRTGVVAVTGGGYTLEVDRAAVTRPGLATPFRIDVRSEDGSNLPAKVTLEINSSYLASFDFNGLQPTPTETFSSGGSTWWTFDVPVGETHLSVDMDARLEPAVQWARAGRVALEIDDEQVVMAEFTTWVMP